MKRDLEERGAGIECCDADERCGGLHGRVHGRLTEAPGLGFNALFRTGGQFFIKRRIGARLKWSSGADLSEAVAQAAIQEQEGAEHEPTHVRSMPETAPDGPAFPKQMDAQRFFRLSAEHFPER